MASTYTRSSIRSDLKTAYAPSSEVSTKLTDTWWNRLIDQAVQKIANDIEFKAFEKTVDVTLVQDQRSYDLTTLASDDVHYIISVQNTTNDKPLYWITKDEAMHWDNTESGEPAFFLPYEEGFEVYPLASSDYAGDTLKVRYRKIPDYLSGDTSVNPLPRYTDEAVFQYALYLAYTRTNEVERSKHAFIVFAGIMRQIKDARAREYQQQDNWYGG